MKQSLVPVSLCAALSAVLISCGGGPSVELNDPVFPTEASTALLMDEVLATVIEIQDQSVSRDENGVILAETLIRNKTSAPVSLMVRCLFKDQLGVTKEVSPWKKIEITSQGRQIYVAPSLNRYSERFIVQIRLSNGNE
ncbi:MAG: hypothetical protein AAF649_02525 [Verrucomicrobiota bacterium]